MGNTPKKSTKIDKEIIDEPKRKSQKVKVLVSVFRVGDNIVSALGIPTVASPVLHNLDKSKMKSDELLSVVSSLTTDKTYKSEQRWDTTIKSVLDNNIKTIPMPSQPANEYSKRPIGKLVHEILNVEIELFID